MTGLKCTWKGVSREQTWRYFYCVQPTNYLVRWTCKAKEKHIRWKWEQWVLTWCAWMLLAAAGSGRHRRSAPHRPPCVCSGRGSVEVALAFAVEFKTSPKSPPEGLVPPTLDFKKKKIQKGQDIMKQKLRWLYKKSNSDFTLKNK